MAEFLLGVLYQVAAVIGRFLVWILSDLAGNKICGGIESYFTSETKLEKNVKRLREEEWFDHLFNDFRYGHIIMNNRRVGRYLSEETNILLLKKHQEEQVMFIQMVKEEHKKFAAFPTK